jgi:hypothetical protein
MPLSDEAARRFAAYVAQTDPSNILVADDGALFDFVGWALVHEPEALGERFAYEGMMSAQGFNSNKMTYVQTVVAVAQPLLHAYEEARRGPGDRA